MDGTLDRVHRVGLHLPRDQGDGPDDAAASLGRASVRARRVAARGDPLPAADLAARLPARGGRGGRPRRRAAGLRRRSRHRRRDSDRLERRRHDRRVGAAAGHRLAHDRAGAGGGRHEARRRRRPRGPRPDRRPRRSLGRFDCDRARHDARRDGLVVDGIVRLRPAPAPTRRLRHDRVRDARRWCSARRRRPPARRGWRPHRRHVGGFSGRLALPRRRRLADRVLGVRVAPAQRPDLPGRHPPVRQSARRDRDRRSAPRRDARRDDRGRCPDRDRRRLRHDPEREPRTPNRCRWSGNLDPAQLRLRGGSSPSSDRRAYGGGRGTRAGPSA